MKALMGRHHHHHHQQQQQVVVAGVEKEDLAAVMAETEYYYFCDRAESENAIAARSSRGFSSEPNHNHNPNPNPNLNHNHNHNPSPNPNLNHNHNHNPSPNANLNHNHNHNPSPNPNLNLNHSHNPNPSPNPNLNLNHNHNPNPNPNLNHGNPNPNPSPNPNLNHDNPNPNHNLNPNPNLNHDNPNPNHKQKHNNQDYHHQNPGEIHDCEDLAMMEQAQISVLALLLAAVRRSAIACHSLPSDEIKMDIGWPTDVQHVAHVTFDRFNGFLGLPLEFEVVGRVPSASASVFGVSPESMQCSYDRHGHSVPTILLLLQERLYSQGGLKAEGIFRINAENSQEKHVRDQLNKGIVPENIDVHCLAGLIKAWLRELPEGVLDSIPPELFLQCNTEEQCLALVEMLPPSEAALLNWVVSLMADVVEEEEINKMNAHNIAMVFAPNMTQMSDPLTALMHAVQVMNFLKTLILKTLRDWKNVGHDEPKDASPTTVMTTYGLTQGNNTRQCCVTTTSSSEANVKPRQCDGIEDDERKGASEQDRYTLDVEERFFRGFSGRGANGDIINERLVHGNMQSCL